jgi:hypothetical protein
MSHLDTLPVELQARVYAMDLAGCRLPEFKRWRDTCELFLQDEAPKERLVTEIMALCDVLDMPWQCPAPYKTGLPGFRLRRMGHHLDLVEVQRCMDWSSRRAFCKTVLNEIDLCVDFTKMQKANKKLPHPLWDAEWRRGPSR